jgi:hypothetical protein
MHIDHSKLVDLLVETSGIEKEKVEAQLNDLVEEIMAAIEEGDAYEVDGFGVFSGIGNNVIFIPSDELSTEINYKYVGMEPIEMDDAPAQEVSEAESEEEDTDIDDDPFAGLLDDVEDESEPAASFELDVPEEETEADPDTPSEEQDQLDEEGEAPFDLDEEEPEVEKPGPDKWGIDTYKDDSAETMFSGLLGKQEEQEAKEDESAEDDHFDALFEQEEEEPKKETSFLDDLLAEEERDEEIEEPAILDKIDASEPGDTEEDEEDFDDPFKTLAGEDDEDELPDLNSSKEEEQEEEIIPVIKNLSSETKKQKKEKESKVKEKESDKESDAKPKKVKKTTSDPKSQPVMLWVLLIIIILGGGTYGLGYYGIVNIPGITPEPQMASTSNQAQATPPETTQPEATPQEQQQTPVQPEQTQETPQETAAEQEQEPESEVRANEEAPADQPRYGMSGVPVSAANNGYTIVIYSLSRENNAEAKRIELSDEGYRVLIASVPSQQYGTLWRVSLGQFRTMRDAALAAEDLGRPFSENYFITKIQ